MRATVATRARTARKTPLDDLLRAAGARMVVRHGHEVAADFGSVDAELQACRQAAGLVDRSDRATTEVRGEPGALDEVARRVTGHAIADGDAVLLGSEWWCRTAPDVLLVRCEAAHVDACRYALTNAACRVPTATVHDATEEWAGVGLLGPNADAVLAGVGLPDATPLRRVNVAGADALLLREDAQRYGFVLAPQDAAAVWTWLRDTGRDHGLVPVGSEALERIAAERRGTAG